MMTMNATAYGDLLCEALVVTIESMAFAQAQADDHAISEIQCPVWARIPVEAHDLRAVVLVLDGQLANQLAQLLYVEDEGEPLSEGLVAEMANILTGRLLLASRHGRFVLGVPTSGSGPPPLKDATLRWGYRVDDEHPLLVALETP